MPTYSYACTECDNRFDAVQAFTDDALTRCPKCSGRLRKLFGSVGVVFKGSGFYRNDSRETKSGGAKSDAAAKSSDAGNGGDSGKGSEAAKTTTTSDSSSGSGKGSGDSGSSGKSSPAPAAVAS